jgi:hypothetical protein
VVLRVHQELAEAQVQVVLRVHQELVVVQVAQVHQEHQEQVVGVELQLVMDGIGEHHWQTQKFIVVTVI